MGPITIEGIIGDGAIWHATRECAPQDAHPCEDHGQWACGICLPPDSLLAPLFSISGLDGSECCDRCTMPLDEAAFEQWMKEQEEERAAHDRNAHTQVGD